MAKSWAVRGDGNGIGQAGSKCTGYCCAMIWMVGASIMEHVMCE